MTMASRIYLYSVRLLSGMKVQWVNMNVREEYESKKNKSSCSNFRIENEEAGCYVRCVEQM